MARFPLFPDQASTTAPQVDTLFLVLVGITFFFGVLIFFCIAYFAIKYREGSGASRANARSEHIPLELAWTIIPLCISFGIYLWASKLYVDMHTAPASAAEVYVVGKQWMWKIQHQQGNREINELHIPVGKPVKLIMTSEDVIHSFFIPAFRIKQDVLPGRYTTEWFQATKVGEYHFFCAQYCGTSHASMIGKVIVMPPAEYAQWLSGSAPAGSMEATGEQLFQQFGCVTCHLGNNTGRGPSLVGLFGKTVQLTSGESVLADQNYIRESVLNPGASVVAGYKPIMPTFRNQISPDQLSQLIEYIKSLGGPATAAKRSTK
jgi:cytochrome c oxidase subunit 2